MNLVLGQKRPIDRLEACISLKDKALGELQQEVSRLAHVKTDAIKLEQELKYLERECGSLSEANKASHAQEVELQKRLGCLEKAHAQECSGLQCRVNGNVLQTTHASKGLLILKREAEKQQKASCELSEELSDLLFSASEKNNTVKTAKEERDALQLAKRVLMGDCQGMERTLDELNEQKERLSEQYATLAKSKEFRQQRLGYAASELERAKTAVSQLSSTLQSALKKKQGAVSQLQESTKRLSSLKQSLEPSTGQTRQRIEALSKANCQLLADLKNSQRLCSELSQQIKQQQSYLASSASRQTHLLDIAQSLETKIAGQRRQANILNDSYGRTRVSYVKAKECERAILRILQERPLNCEERRGLLDDI